MLEFTRHLVTRNVQSARLRPYSWNDEMRLDSPVCAHTKSLKDPGSEENHMIWLEKSSPRSDQEPVRAVIIAPVQ